jgi:tetratricopeptide (TPR) repeat protein
VVGISKYEQSPVVPNLAYADQDALLVQKYLESARGGRAVIKLLLNDQATSGAIRNQFLDLKRRAGRNDTVWLFVAAHGEMLPVGDAVPFSQKVPSIITHRADPQDVRISSFPMQEAENWMLGKTAPFGRAMIFLDLCHAGHFIEFRNAGGVPAAEYFGIMATHQGPDALAYEHPIFGGGHGAFTYFLLRGLNTDEARVSGDPFIRAARLASYVRNAVEQATSFHQSPTPLGGVNLGTPVADLGQPGIPFQKIPLDRLKIPDKDLIEVKKGRRGRAGKTDPQTDPQAVTPPLLTGADPDVQASIELENLGEQVLLDYLKGDQTPQSEQEFEQGDRVFTAALALQPGSPYLQARASFCRGRVLVFRKQYPAAVAQLERSIRLEPDAAYAYNALGIAYLEAADYDRAQRAFQDAIGRAPLWAYPRHNLALAYAQRGQYNAAIAAYRAAMDRAASYFYLPYNLGLLYARLNRHAEAEEMYRRASRLAPGRAEPLTALAQLDAVRGNDRRARRELEEILQMPAQSEIAMQAARHNHALLLAKNRKTLDRALAEWRQNGDYLPSQFSAAQALARNNRTGEAVNQYRHILTLTPDSVAARLELVGQMQKAGASIDELARVLEAGIPKHSRHPVLYERLGKLYRAAGRSADARAAYRAALEGTNDPNARKRIEGILKSLPE